MMEHEQYLISCAMQKDARVLLQIPTPFGPKGKSDLITIGTEDPKHPLLTPEEEQAAIEEGQQALRKRLNVTPFLTGSMAMGTHVPGAVDLDYTIPLKSKEKLLRLAERLRKHPEFKASPYHPETSDYQIFTWARENKLPIDVALAYGDKAMKYKAAVQEAAAKLTPEEREQIRKEKARLQKAWFMRQSRYRKYKRDLDARLGIQQARMHSEPLDKAAEELEETEVAVPAVEDTEALKERLKQMLSRPSVFAHRTTNLTPLVETRQQMTAEQAARKGLLQTVEETKGFRGRAEYDPEKHKNLRKELFGTERGIMPAGEDYGRYGLVRYSKSKRPSPYFNLVPNEVISPRNTGMKTAIFLVPREELVEWQTKYPDKKFLANEDVPEDLVLPNRRFIHLPVRALRQVTNLLTLQPTPLVG
jgi:hypothetical protein